MAEISICFNHLHTYHKKVHRFAWLFAAAFYSVPLVLLATLYGRGEYSFRNGLFSVTYDVFLLGCCLLQNFTVVHISLMFMTLLNGLKTRFAALNSFLR